MNGFRVVQPGILTLIQDAGRYGHHRIGLTSGGPLDGYAFKCANKLLGNALDSTALEVSVGGLVLEAQIDTLLVVTGANMPLSINGQPMALWQTHKVQEGDRIELGYATQGARAYLAVSGGFEMKPSFGSTATVTREAIGGLAAGQKLAAQDFLPCPANPHVKQVQMYRLPKDAQPDYASDNSLRVVLGYQQHLFSDVDKRIFFSSEYEVTNRADRMGYRLSGPDVKASVDGILSEGICHGAIQIPADGQPIVLLNDRQTIGGYPKIGAMIAGDTARLAQLLPGAKVHFEAITIDEAHNLLCLDHARFERILLEKVS